MIGIYEQVLDILVQQYRVMVQQQPLQLSNASDSGHGDPNAPKQAIYLGNYEVDASEVPCVFGGLITIQMRKFASFLTRLRAVVATWNWDTHCSMLLDIEDRVRISLKVCERH